MIIWNGTSCVARMMGFMMKFIVYVYCQGSESFPLNVSGVLSSSKMGIY